MVLRYLATCSAKWCVSAAQVHWPIKVLTGQTQYGSISEIKLYSI